MLLRPVAPLVALLFATALILPATGAANDLDLSKALVIGHGPKTVIEFTDPDCPFCRKAAAYFANRPDVTKYVFFMPLAKHPEAKRKVQYILSHSNKAKAYHEVMAGRLDSADTRTLPVTARGIKLQEQQQEIASKMKINATPTFMINGRIIEGADLVKIEEALGRP